jgi:hypothetical protein
MPAVRIKSETGLARDAGGRFRDGAGAASGRAVDQRPAAARRTAALSVFSQVNSGSSRPKWP